MNKHRLPIALMHARCRKCNLPTEFQAFESGAGGEFATYVGLRTHDTYRVNLAKVQYHRASLSDLLEPALKREGTAGLRAVPEESMCKLCGGSLDTSATAIDGEVMIEAYDL
jgi:hypothetical protein